MPTIEELPGNSFKARTTKAEEELPKPKVTSVITAPVTRTPKKKSGLANFAEKFFGETTDTVGNTILWEILIPAAIDTILEMIKTGAEMILWGSSKGTHIGKDRGRSLIDYSSISTSSRSDRRERREPIRPKTSEEYEDIVLARRKDAERVLEALRDILDQYEVVSVADLLGLCDITPKHSDYKFGWYALGRASVERVRDGYILDLPKAEELT